MDELEKKLNTFYAQKKASNSQNLPGFEALLAPKPRRKSLRLAYRLSLIASLGLLLGTGWWYFQSGSPQSVAIKVGGEVPQATQGLMPKPEYLWEWQSPTQSLLKTQYLYKPNTYEK